MAKKNEKSCKDNNKCTDANVNFACEIAPQKKACKSNEKCK